MATTTISGIPVEFPFEPYDIQKNYMNNVIECLETKSNGVLESPTGTGKTLSLLCATLAWVQNKKNQVQAQRIRHIQATTFGDDNNQLEDTIIPKIIYSSRTHSQLKQAMKELKLSAYCHMKAVILGSREQMCLNAEVQKLESNSAQTQMCRLKVKNRSCSHHRNVERKRHEPRLAALAIVDMEDIVTLGREHCFCPYYMAREIKQNADIIFAPYNYLLDERTRRSLGLNLANNVVILDEAHNIEKICEDAASIQLRSTDLTLAIEEVTDVMKALDSDVCFDDDLDAPEINPEALCKLKEILLKLEVKLDSISMSNENEGATFEGHYIYEIFDGVGVDTSKVTEIADLIDKLIQYLVTAAGTGPFQRRGNGLQVILDLVRLAFASNSADFKGKVNKCYKVHMRVDAAGKGARLARKQKTRVLSFWCFSPSFGMNIFKNEGLHSLVLTSGTLAPLQPLISELELHVPVRLQNPHIVGKNQICVKIMGHGPDGKELLATYANREKPEYLASLGYTLANLIRHIPSGVLIFFPSYPFMLCCMEYWKNSGAWSMISKDKPIFVEPKDKNTFRDAMNEYYAKVADPTLKGAIFMGVCRGKVSEGLDFDDANGRAVFVIGLPYPPLKDPKIVLKKQYLDNCNKNDKQFLKGDEWYNLEATRAINQAIGRVIRHKNDYGAIILLDPRFNHFKVKSNLSLWLQQHITGVQSYQEVLRSLRAFYETASEQFPVVPKAPKKPKPTEPLSREEINSEWLDPYYESSSSTLVNIHKRKLPFSQGTTSRKKFVVSSKPVKFEDVSLETSLKEYIIMVQKTLDEDSFRKLHSAIIQYKMGLNWQQLEICLDEIFIPRQSHRYLILGLVHIIHQDHTALYEKYCRNMGT